MPHKHVRRKDSNGKDFNLGPADKAQPLPTFDGSLKKKHQKNGVGKQNAKRKRSTATQNYKEDDTPREFARMMQFQATGKRPSGLDDGSRRAAKKRKASQTDNTAITPPTAPVTPKVDLPKILPGERLADYSARVDQALPIGGLERKGKVQVDGVKERMTKTEKRLKKMYASWREDDARRKDKEEEFQEQQEEAEEEQETELGGQAVKFASKRKKMIGEQADEDDDPWAVLKLKRDAPRGLHDVAKAPPEFTVKPTEKFKVRNGVKVDVLDVPIASGSLKRREELSDARRDVIERYRAMMKEGKS